MTPHPVSPPRTVVQACNTNFPDHGVGWDFFCLVFKHSGNNQPSILLDFFGARSTSPFLLFVLILDIVIHHVYFCFFISGESSGSKRN
jgi:hypothetical protein